MARRGEIRPFTKSRRRIEPTGRPCNSGMPARRWRKASLPIVAFQRCRGLIELNGEASGELTVDPNLPFPVEAHMEYRFDMRMRVLNEGQTSELNSHVEMKFDVRTP